MKSNPTKSISSKARTSSSSSSSLKTTPTKSTKTKEDLLYKNKGIKVFDLKGMFHQKLNPNTDNGAFSGSARCEDNSHDKYAVGIYNEQNKLLGYTPKGNKRLNFSLNNWHNGKVTVWGNLRYDDFENKWYGTVNIPVGYSPEELEKLELILKLKLENENQIKLKEKETDKYFEILNKHQKIKELSTDLNNPAELYYSFPKNLVPSISSHLEKEKNWEKLVELEKHQDLINDLSEKYKEATLKRINTAKENVA